MTLEQITLALFAACNSIRIIAYLAQVLRTATDKNGASSISLTTWLLFSVANLSTVAYALINRSDWGLALCFSGNALCCIAILLIACWKRRSHAQRAHQADRPLYPVFEKA